MLRIPNSPSHSLDQLRRVVWALKVLWLDNLLERDRVVFLFGWRSYDQDLWHYLLLSSELRGLRRNCAVPGRFIAIRIKPASVKWDARHITEGKAQIAPAIRTAAAGGGVSSARQVEL